jgi:hypothetical protein
MPLERTQIHFSKFWTKQNSKKTKQNKKKRKRTSNFLRINIFYKLIFVINQIIERKKSSGGNKYYKKEDIIPSICVILVLPGYITIF